MLSASASSPSSTRTARSRPPTRSRSRTRSRALGPEISRIGSDTKFNGITLLSGTPTVTFQVGADDGQTITVARRQPVRRRLELLGRLGDLHRLLDDDDGRDRLGDPERRRRRATFGAAQNRIEHTLNGLAAYEENLPASESRIRDVDMASEMTTFTKYQILQQAGTSMLAQANIGPAGGAQPAPWLGRGDPTDR